jgi:hypothetical protein
MISLQSLPKKRETLSDAYSIAKRTGHCISSKKEKDSWKIFEILGRLRVLPLLIDGKDGRNNKRFSMFPVDPERSVSYTFIVLQNIQHHNDHCESDPFMPLRNMAKLEGSIIDMAKPDR